MIPFQKESFILIIWGLEILLGNQAFPIVIRLIVASIYKTKKFIGHEDHDFEVYLQSASNQEIYGYMLKNPRKVYTHLFPRTQVLALEVIDIVDKSFIFYITCIHNSGDDLLLYFRLE